MQQRLKVWDIVKATFGMESIRGDLINVLNDEGSNGKCSVLSLLPCLIIAEQGSNQCKGSEFSANATIPQHTLFML